MVYLVRFWGLFTWLQRRFRPSDPDAMRNTALETTTASSSGNKTDTNEKILTQFSIYLSNVLLFGEMRNRATERTNERTHSGLSHFDVSIAVCFVLFLENFTFVHVSLQRRRRCRRSTMTSCRPRQMTTTTTTRTLALA